MKIKRSLSSRLRRKLAGFSMIEVTIGMGVIGTTCAALLTGITTGFFTMRMARENLRATQIILEKVETIRLYSWDQINTAGFIPATFTEFYIPTRTNSTGLLYNGTMTIAPAPITNSYSADITLLTINLSWPTGYIHRTRHFSTFISPH